MFGPRFGFIQPGAVRAALLSGPGFAISLHAILLGVSRDVSATRKRLAPDKEKSGRLFVVISLMKCATGSRAQSFEIEVYERKVHAQACRSFFSCDLAHCLLQCPSRPPCLLRFF